MMKIATLLLFIGLVCLARPIFSQDYRILNEADCPDLSAYNAVLTHVNLDKYRNWDNRRILKFENGLEVELFSIKEMDPEVNVSDRDVANQPQHSEAIFTIQNGYLLERVRPVNREKLR